MTVDGHYFPPPDVRLAQEALVSGTYKMLADFSKQHKKKEMEKGRTAESITAQEFVGAANNWLEDCIVAQIPAPYNGQLYLAKLSYNSEPPVCLDTKRCLT